MKKLTFGYALTGSFCTFERSLAQMEYIISEGIDILPIMSYNASKIDTRFGRAADFIESIEAMTGNKVIRTLPDAEPIGPKKMTDLMIVLPCTGNTLAKLAAGIYDTPVTLAVKSHLRNQRPVLIGVSTNDALAASAKNIGMLMNYKNYYFIPMRQDDYNNKPLSIVCDFERTLEAALNALDGRQLEPIIF